MWNTLGISNSQICRDIMEPMSQEFVTELNDDEVKLNEEINLLLNGIDFQQSLSQEKSPTSIPSSFPEENGFTSEQHANIKRDEHICSSPLLFTQEKKGENFSNPCIATFHMFRREEKSNFSRRSYGHFGRITCCRHWGYLSY